MMSKMVNLILNLLKDSALLDEIKDLITLIVACIGSYVAIAGLSIWEKEHKGKEEFNVARQLLLSAFRVRNAIRIVRNPFIDITESDRAQKEFDREESNSADVYQLRWNRLQEFLNEYELRLLEAEVFWGKEIYEKQKSLRECTSELWLALRKFLDKSISKTPEEHRSIGEIIYDTGTYENPDDFAKKVDQAMEELKKYLKPHLKIE